MRRIPSLFACLAIALAALTPTLAADPAWKPVAVPDAWKNPPDGENIFQWYRASVKVPAEWKGRELLLVVEAADDAREFYIGGEKVGSFGDLPPKYRSGLGGTKQFKIEPKLVKPGEETLVAIRVCNNQSRTGFNVAAPVLFGGDQAIRMAGQWEMTAGDDLAWAKAASKPATAAFAKLESRADVEQSLKKLQNDEGPLSPEKSLAKCTTPDDLVATIVLSEPEIGQPLSIKWDTRGRMWVMQYLQYPNPAGLTMVSRDKFLRTVYDKIPPPPPNHFKGADKITIHEDTDGDGKFDKHKTFLDGLSLATSFAFGKGGVWVLNPPYLLFYPVKEGEDVPSGDPVVHLEGFGIEDSHSIASNLRWGPDGWLYASQGSTVTGDIKRPGLDKVPVHSLGQLIWRYHPEQKKYEIFAEGGGNTFGVEIDSKGRIYSGHNGGNTRGFHYVQGGYYQKGFGKHGSLSNPYTFGYFEAMGHHNVQRFTHCFVIYDGGSLPEKYNGKLFGVVPLLSHVVMSDVLPDRSSFKTKDIGYALESKDPWFRPVDIQVGPDGAIYVADMYEQRIDHASHYQGRIDTKSGRIYRIAGKDTKPAGKFDLGKETSEKLFERLGHKNKWFRQTAQEELLRRGKNAKDLGMVLSAFLEYGPIILKDVPTLESLWAVNNLKSGLSNEQLLKALDSTDPDVRLWGVRLACDNSTVSIEMGRKLADLAYRESNVEVRSQLACSARRLPAPQSMAIVKNLAGRSEDVGDIHIPLLLWWAIEAKADSDRNDVLALFADKAFWDQPLVAQHLSERLMRRYGATGQRKDLLACARLLELAPTKEHAGKLMAGLESAYEGRSLANLPAELVTAMTKAGATSPTLKLRQGDATAVADALKLLADEKADVTKRQQFIQIFGTIQQPTSVPVLLKLAKESRNDALRSAALASLQSYKDETIGADVVALYKDLPDQVREVAQTLLSSRAAWSLLLVNAIDVGKIDKQTISDSTVQKLLLHGAPQITQLCKKHFGETASGASPEVVRQQLEKLTAIMNTASGNPYQGKKLFLESCGKCHKLFDDGGNIGPNLTTYKRDDLRGMLLNVVSPSAEIREGFENYLVRTADGRTLNGFIADQDPQVVVLKGADGQSISLARDDIEDMKAVKISIMPEGQLKAFTDQQIRDLFAYLRSTQPLP
jgi:putative membrane-bound dehydrogenase-like protein